MKKADDKKSSEKVETGQEPFNSKETLHYVFGITQQLEKYMEVVHRLIKEKEVSPKTPLPVSLEQQEHLVKEMRRVANMLQLDFAKDDWLNIVRNLRIFYGLNQLVRPEILATILSLSSGMEKPKNENTAPTCH